MSLLSAILTGAASLTTQTLSQRLSDVTNNPQDALGAAFGEEFDQRRLLITVTEAGTLSGPLFKTDRMILTSASVRVADRFDPMFTQGQSHAHTAGAAPTILQLSGTQLFTEAEGAMINELYNNWRDNLRLFAMVGDRRRARPLIANVFFRTSFYSGYFLEMSRPRSALTPHMTEVSMSIFVTNSYSKTSR